MSEIDETTKTLALLCMALSADGWVRATGSIITFNAGTVTDIEGEGRAALFTLTLKNMSVDDLLSILPALRREGDSVGAAQHAKRH